MPVVESFPEGGLERLELLQKAIPRVAQKRDTSSAKLSSGASTPRSELLADPEETDRRIQVIDALAQAGSTNGRGPPGLRFFAGAASCDRAGTRDLEDGDGKHETAFEGAFLHFSGVACVGAFGFIASGYPYIASGVFAVTILPMLWYRRQLRLFQGMEQQFDSCTERMETCANDVRAIEDEARGIETEIRKLTGKTDITQEDIDVRAADLESRAKIAEELRRLDDSIERGRSDVDRLSVQIAEVQDAIDLLFTEASAADEKQFIERAEIFKQRQQLVAELERLPAEPPEPGLLFDVRVNEEEAYEDTAGTRRSRTPARGVATRVRPHCRAHHADGAQRRAVTRTGPPGSRAGQDRCLGGIVGRRDAVQDIAG